nr:hypothetical protein [Tanacetum cinerariifolium]
MPVTRQGANYDAIEQLINRRVAEALDAYEANMNSENRNGNGNDNGNGSQDSESGRYLKNLIRWKSSFGVFSIAFRGMQADNKRRIDNSLKDNHAQQPPYRRQNVARASTVRPSEKRKYTARDCGGTTVAANQRALMENQRTLTCFECGNQGHFHSECPNFKNQNCRNQAGSSEVRGREYALGGGQADQSPNNITDNVDA